jgi:hypothetical protein
LLRDDVRTQADLIGLTLRHTDAQLTRFINQAINAFREDISAEGIAHFLTSATGTTVVGVTSGFPFQTLSLAALSPNVVRVYGVDIRLTDGRWITLRSVDFTERTQYQCRDDSGGAIPEAFASITTYTVALLPAPGTALTYRVWYLPVATDLSADADAFDGVTGWEDYVVMEVCLRTVVRDRHAEAYALLSAERDRCWRRVLKGSSRVNAAGGTLVRVDTLGRARSARFRNLGRH